MRHSLGGAPPDDLLERAVEICERKIRPLDDLERANLKRWLRLCQRAEGLEILSLRGEPALLAFFNYRIDQGPMVADQKLDELEGAELYGECVHIVALVAPHGYGGELFRAIVRGHNAKAVSAHRRDERGRESFHFKINRHYRRDVDALA